MNEGGRVERATFVGFDEDWADTLAPAARLILADVELVFDKEARQSSCGFGSCVRALSACRTLSPLSVEFTMRIAPRRRVAVALGAGSLAAVASFGGLASDTLVQGAAALRGDLDLRFEREATQSEIQALNLELEATRAAQAEFEAEWSAFVGTGTSSLPFASLTGLAFEALGSAAALESLKVSAEGEGVHFQAIAVTPSDAQRSAGAMGHALEVFEAAGVFDELILDPETRVPTQDDAAQLLRFVVQGDWDPRAGFGAGGGDGR
jgi:hypothetical protein